MAVVAVCSSDFEARSRIMDDGDNDDKCGCCGDDVSLEDNIGDNDGGDDE